MKRKQNRFFDVKQNRFFDVTLPYTIGFLVAMITYTHGMDPFIAFIVGETVAFFSCLLVRFLIRVLLDML